MVPIDEEKELKQGLSLLREGALTGKNIFNRMKESFRKFDAENTSYLNPMNFTKALQDLNVGLTPTQAKFPLFMF